MEEPQNQRNSSLNNICVKLGFITIMIFLLFNIYQIYNSIWLIHKQYQEMDIQLFRKIYLYKGFFDIYKEFHFLVLCLDIIILMISSFEWNYRIGLLFENCTDTFIYFNYLFYGPFLFGVVILCMKYGNEITFIYDIKTQKNVALDYENIFIIFIYIFISFTIAIIGPIFYSFNYLNNSIKFKRYGNYLIGKIFWYFALKYSDGLGLRVNNNVGNAPNQNGQEIQNIILPFDENALLLGNNFID